jgi:hypothetical protein
MRTPGALAQRIFCKCMGLFGSDFGEGFRGELIPNPFGELLSKFHIEDP